MPFILQLLMGLLGFGAGAGASALAKRFIAPAIGKQIGKFLPGLAGKSILGTKATIGGAGTGAVGLGGFFGGFAGFDAATQAALGTEGGEPPPDQTVNDIVAGVRQLPFQREQQEGMQRIFQESEIRQVLDLLGVDFDEFSQLAQPSGRLI